jgi:hypothetical protein
MKTYKYMELYILFGIMMALILMPLTNEPVSGKPCTSIPREYREIAGNLAVIMIVLYAMVYSVPGFRLYYKKQGFYCGFTLIRRVDASPG